MSRSYFGNAGLFVFAAVLVHLPALSFAQTVLELPVDTISEGTTEYVAPSQVIVPSAVFEPKWVWDNSTTGNQSVTLVQHFRLASIPQFARLDVTVDNEYSIIINGNVVPNPKDDKDWKTIESIDIEELLIVGGNFLEIHATNQDGPAGAIALIQMRTAGVLASVGTGDQSQIVTGNLLTPATVVGSAFGAPWNLTKPASESAKDVQVRRETKLLMEEIGSSDAEVSARAMVLMAHLAVEQGSTSFDDPIFNLSSAKPFVSVLQKAKERIRDELHAAQEPLSKTPRLKFNGALSAAKLLVSKGKADAVQEFFAAEFSQPRSNVEAFQIALISTIGEWISSDDKAIQGARTKVKTKTDEVESKTEEHEAKRGEIESSEAKIKEIQASIDSIQPRVTRLETEITALKTEITKLEMEIARLNDETQTIALRAEKSRLESEVALRTADKNLLVQIVRPSLEKEIASEGAKRNAAMAAKIVLDEQLKKLAAQLAELETTLNKLVTPSIRRLNSVETFLVNNRSHLASGFVRALHAATLDTIRTSRMTFLEIDAFNVAKAGIAKPSGIAEAASAFGARTSAAELPGVSDRSVGERPGVSETAPFDPTVTGMTRVFLPAMDYRGERELTGAKNNPDSEVEKAPGAEGAVFIRSEE